MYTSYYKLEGKPFQLSPNPEFFFGSRAHKRAISYLTYGLQQGEGFIVITGDIGAGKTTLVAYLQKQLSDERFFVARVNAGQIDARGVLHLVARALGLAPNSVDAGALLAAIEDDLRARARRRQRVLLIVDEVQNLPLEALEQLRLLSNLEQDGRALLQTLLVGQPQFRERLNSAELEQLRQRIVASYHLGPLEETEVQAYIEHRLRKVGWSGDPLIDLAAYREIYTATGGLPRRINLLCSRLLLHGALEGKHRLTAEDVRLVADELRVEQAAPEGAEAESRPPPRPEPVGAGARTTRESLFATAAPGLAEFGEEFVADSPAYWRREVERLQRKLETVYDEVLRERHRYDEAREEAIRLREELHRREVEQLRIDAETARRLAELIAKVGGGEKAGLLARLFRRD